jgi:hypothetical protein
VRAIEAIVASRGEDVSNLWICYPLRVRGNHQRE